MSFTSRRSFLKHAAAGLILAPAFVPRLISAPPSGRILHASFGAGGMARTDLNQICTHPAVTLAAVADIEPARANDLKQKWPDLRVYADWRELIEREKDLDSVNVSTPDHMHAPIAMTAMNRGLHVYGQKPLTHDIYESRQLTLAARRKKRVTQMGIQIHSAIQYRLAVALIQSGAIGKVREVHTWSNKQWGDLTPVPPEPGPVPTGIDWDLWLGVCEERPFIPNGWYHPGNWRKRLDFGTGTFGDMGCHIFDPVFEAVGLTAPLSVRSLGSPPNSHSWATDAVIEYVFPGNRFSEGKNIPVTWYDGTKRPGAEIVSKAGGKLPVQGSVFVGTEGVMVLPHISKPILLPAEKYAGYQLPEVAGTNHWHQFVDAILGKARASANFDYSGPLTEAVLLGSVATRFPQQTLRWEAAKLRFKDHKEATKFVRRPYRKGWEVKGL